MAETQRQTNSSDVGNATASSSRVRRARGVSDVQGVSQKINQDDFLSRLDSLPIRTTNSGVCAVGKLLKELPESMSLRLNQALQNHSVTATTIALLLNDFGFDISSTTVRRHRRRMDKKDGCKCNNES